jgi:transcriptional regulator with XRE-family HTH domain
MPQEFAQCELKSKGKVRTMRNDALILPFHAVRMVRTKKTRLRWYAKEWLAEKKLKQTDVVSRTTYNKGQVSEYVNGSRRWNEDVLAAFALAIGVDAPDLLRPPSYYDNELAAYVMKMDARDRAKALKVLKAISTKDDDKSEDAA